MLAASQIHMTVAEALHQVHHYNMEERIECSLHYNHFAFVAFRGPSLEADGLTFLSMR